MPPFREGPIEVDRRLDGKALHALRQVGHGRRINIVDASYDVPDGAKKIKFPGSSAQALLAIARLIPLDEGHQVTYMRPDPSIEESQVNFAALNAFREVAEALDEQAGRIGINLYAMYRKEEDELAQDSEDPGFYNLASDEDERHLFVVTTDELPFACASLVVGHSQLTE